MKKTTIFFFFVVEFFEKIISSPLEKKKKNNALFERPNIKPKKFNWQKIESHRSQVKLFTPTFFEKPQNKKLCVHKRVKMKHPV